MSWEEVDDTRSRILRTARQMFTEQGYQRTSLRQIAERLRLTKAAILYHFPSKAHLLTDLAEPFVRDLENVLDRAGALPAGQGRWSLLEGWTDVMLAHRDSLGMLYHDLALVDRGTNYQRLMRIAMRANEIVAGPNPGVRERVRAVQALAMCGDPVLFLTEVPEHDLREDMLDGVRRLLADGPPAERATAAVTRTATRTATGTTDGAADDGDGGAADDGDAAGTGPDKPSVPAAVDPRPRGGRRRPGRPRSMSPDQVSAARRMHLAGTHSANEIAAEFGVSRATVYRHLESNPDIETIST
ncbi:TetR family transcriptional regulator [Micromonospora craniellae]|uniref:TetR family transcriptional regulator n=1 Tax=Micromonospora craniellae TaxID=2294034 RepID=A0A372G0G1_9ACTN|nr:TetR family transcriptional regulator [Micromonospora craniellae]QOC91663.1 TetR family transcriptional regulator [Micromonospora craniellae]RFS46557.1 TetR family transcriptional regulator [Micromonospora craniellae]